MKNVLLIGNPNCGKSLLFQQVTGFYQKVANFPGVTVEVKRGEKDGITWIDFPGTYSLTPLSKEEEIAVDKLLLELDGLNHKTLVCLVDATKLERSLLLAHQAKQLASEKNVPLVIAVNMMDEVEKLGGEINLKGLAQELNVPVYGISAKTKQGLAELNIDLAKDIEVPEKSLHTSEEIQSICKELNQKYGLAGQTLVKKNSKLDEIFLSNWFGGIIFATIMLFLFQAIFTWAGPLMDGTEEIIAWLAGLVAPIIPEGFARDFVNDAIFGGFGSFVVFAPQIAILTLIIGFLEDSGYLARASIIAHAPLRLFGLSGRAFVPYLSGHACAIPAIMAARTIESPRKRLISLVTIPFTSCSARLPVYALLVSAFIPATAFAGGLIGLQGIAFFGLYALGIFTALLVSAVLNRTLPKEVEDSPFIIELPSYRMPNWKPLLQRAVRSAWTFIIKAGPMIFAVNMVIWLLGYFPNGGADLGSSYLANLGQFIEPIVEPLGLDWKYGVAIIVSFLAREVFVGTLGTLFGIEGADEAIDSLANKIQADGLSLGSGMALLVFYALAMQCVSTLAVLKSETGGYKVPSLVFLGYTFIAYLFALITFQIF